MKIELSEVSIRAMFYSGILKHSEKKHEGHHVALLDVLEPLCKFECIDCEIQFESTLIDSNDEALS